MFAGLQSNRFSTAENWVLQQTSTGQWRSQPKIFFGPKQLRGEMFHFRRIPPFDLGYRLQKHKITI